MSKPRQVCPSCAGPKEPGRGRKLCLACADRLRPIWERASAQRKLERSRNLALETGRDRKLFAKAPPGQKWCPMCKQYLPTGDFGPSRKLSGFAARCRECESNYSHARRLETVFGITAHEYERLLAMQEGRCAICRNRPRTRRLAVDHDHSTGVVRGLLCTRCNQKVLGGGRDNPDLLRRAAAYIESPPALTGELPQEGSVDVLLASEMDAALHEAAARGGGPAVAVIERKGWTVGEWFAVLPLADLAALLVEAGYGGSPEVEAAFNKTFGGGA